MIRNNKQKRYKCNEDNREYREKVKKTARKLFINIKDNGISIENQIKDQIDKDYHNRVMYSIPLYSMHYYNSVTKEGKYAIWIF